MSLEQYVEAGEREVNHGLQSAQKQQRPSSYPCRYKTGRLSSSRQEGRASYKPMTHSQTTSRRTSIGGGDSPATPFSPPGEWR